MSKVIKRPTPSFTNVGVDVSLNTSKPSSDFKLSEFIKPFYVNKKVVRWDFSGSRGSGYARIS